jgi:ankyrin repeat protein
MSPGVRSHDGETPLHICSANGSIDCARVLIESGADVLEKVNDDVIISLNSVRIAGDGHHCFMRVFTDIGTW